MTYIERQEYTYEVDFLHNVKENTVEELVANWNAEVSPETEGEDREFESITHRANPDGTMTSTIVTLDLEDEDNEANPYHILGHILPTFEADVKIYNHETGELLEAL